MVILILLVIYKVILTLKTIILNISNSSHSKINLYKNRCREELLKGNPFLGKYLYNKYNTNNNNNNNHNNKYNKEEILSNLSNFFNKTFNHNRKKTFKVIIIIMQVP